MENTFDKEKVSSLNVSYSLPNWKLKLEASVFNLNNYVYMNRFARPQQASSAIQVTQFALTKNFVLRNFHFDNLIYFQSTTDAARLPLPDLASTNALYYQDSYLKKQCSRNWDLTCITTVLITRMHSCRQREVFICKKSRRPEVILSSIFSSI
ncbi:MAG: hypothetical protein IPG90_04880 [Bacteroidetes bacterium]|nr:hypothetical protein [Bacteroidota bacterium]